MPYESLHTPTLYHYTSGNGLLGIVSTQGIWASGIQYLNDYNEYSHAIELAIKILRETKQKDNATACDSLTSALDCRKSSSLHVCCFTEIQDSLSQWRGYCPSGFGYNIGFNGARLRTVAKEQGFDLRPCIYDSQTKDRLITQWVADSIKDFEFAELQHTVHSANTDPRCESAIRQFQAFAPFLKHHSFKEEKEWRLVSPVFFGDPRLELRPGKSMLIPYLSIDLKLMEDKEILDFIFVGPSPNLELAVNSAIALFQKIYVKGIGSTHIPYRDW